MSEAGLTSAEVARLSGLSESLLRSRLAAQDSFNLFELVQLAAALDCRVVDLVPEAGDAC